MASELALCCMSHTPLLGSGDPGEAVVRRVQEALRGAREFAEAFDPDLVVIFGPDHYQGFRYELMPPFCVGMSARAIGDYNTGAGELDVPQGLADDLVAYLLDADLDVAMSEKMVVEPLNPDLDRQLLRQFESGDLSGFDEMSVGWLGEQGGSSIHEVRSWIAAHAALRTAGPYRTESSFYQPVPDWIIGFAVTTAKPGATIR